MRQSGGFFRIRLVAEGEPSRLFARVMICKTIRAVIAECALFCVFVRLAAILDLPFSSLVVQRTFPADRAKLLMPFARHAHCSLNEITKYTPTR